MSDLFAAVPPQVRLGEHQQTFDVKVHALGDGKVAVTLRTPNGQTTLQTRHCPDTEADILLTIAAIANAARPQLERLHRADMTARGYRA